MLLSLLLQAVAAVSNSAGLAVMGAGIGAGLVALGAGLGIGRIVSAALNEVALAAAALLSAAGRRRTCGRRCPYLALCC